jgi:3-oxoacyl-[acyl-carrier-protein] synthase-3
MLISTTTGVKIAGISVARPSQLLEVTSYNDIFGEDVVSKFSEMTGVKSVCRSIPQQTASDLGYEAAENLLSEKNIDRGDVGILIFVSQKPDYRSPSTAFILHKRLGLKETCTAFDINLACSGFMYGLQTAISLLNSSDSKIALLITADTSVKSLAPEDRTMIMLFGDSGSATLLQKDDDSDSIEIGMRTDGSRFKSIITPSGAYRNRFVNPERTKWSDDISRSDYDTHMKGMDVFGFSITDVPQLLKEFMSLNETAPDNYDWFSLHQANMYILKQVSRKLKIPMEKILICLDRFGNNSSNSVPLLLADHFGDLQEGSFKTLMAGFGAGLSWACGAATIEYKNVLPIVITDSFYKEANF